jgi:hypothetical protein
MGKFPIWRGGHPSGLSIASALVIPPLALLSPMLLLHLLLSSPLLLPLPPSPVSPISFTFLLFSLSPLQHPGPIPLPPPPSYPLPSLRPLPRDGPHLRRPLLLGVQPPRPTRARRKRNFKRRRNSATPRASELRNSRKNILRGLFFRRDHEK